MQPVFLIVSSQTKSGGELKSALLFRLRIRPAYANGRRKLARLILEIGRDLNKAPGDLRIACGLCHLEQYDGCPAGVITGLGQRPLDTLLAPRFEKREGGDSVPRA